MGSEPFHHHLFPPRCRVLGRELRAFSLWHLAALEAVHSPLRPGAPPHDSIELGDLQAAVQICRTRWPQPPHPRPSLRDVCQQWRHREDARFLQTHAEAFAAYTALHCAGPELWEDEERTGRQLTAPGVLSIVAALARFPAFTLDAIWNDITPGFARWLLCADRERQEAGIRFVTDEDDADPGEDTLREQSEAEIEALALSQLGPVRGRAWIEIRRENLRRGTLEH